MRELLAAARVLAARGLTLKVLGREQWRRTVTARATAPAPTSPLPASSGTPGSLDYPAILRRQRAIVEANPSLRAQLEREVSLIPPRPETVCPVCDGARFVAGPLRQTSSGVAMSGPPSMLREVLPCESCVEQPSAALLLAHSGLPERMRSWTFETFRGDHVASSGTQRWAVLVANGYGAGSLLLAGGNGRGKTGLAAAAVNYMCSKGIAVRFVVVRDMLQEIRRRIPTNQADAYRDGIRAAQVLVMDDITAEKSSEFVEETMLAIVDARLSAGRPTLVTTHSSPADIEAHLGAPTASRLREYEVVEVRGSDMRGMR